MRTLSGVKTEQLHFQNGKAPWADQAAKQSSGTKASGDSVTLSAGARSLASQNTGASGAEVRDSMQRSRKAVSTMLNTPAAKGGGKSRGSKAKASPQQAAPAKAKPAAAASGKSASAKAAPSKEEAGFNKASNAAEAAPSLNAAASSDNRLADYADDFAGKNFKKGQTKRCADFVSTMIRDAGVAPEGFEHQYSAAGLRQYGEKVAAKDELQAGDLVYFKNTYRKGDPTHVGIYLGEGKFVHRPTSNKPVRVDSLTEGYFSNHYSSARRLDMPASGIAAAPADPAPAAQESKT